MFRCPAKLPFVVALIAFAAIKLVTFRFLGSPGMHMLSIDRAGCVDPHIYHRESWLTVLIGVLFILDGTKQLVRWMQIPVIKPLFGAVPTAEVDVAAYLAAGALYIATGYLSLKLKRAGLRLVIAAVGGTLVSCVLSWSLWDDWAAGMAPMRRALQELPVRANEVEFTQALMPEAIVVGASVVLIAVLATCRRLGVFRPNSMQPH